MSNDPNLEKTNPVREVRESRQPGAIQRQEVVYDPGKERIAFLYRLSQFIWLLSGALLATLGLRFILKLMAANPANVFAALLYRFTDIFLWPFFGLTVTPATHGVVLEIPTLIAIVIYALLTWALVKLIWILFEPGESRRVTTYHQEHR